MRMFKPKTERIQHLVNKDGETISQLEQLLKGSVHMYIDFANVRPWATKLGWHIDAKRLKQFLDSFDNIKSIKFYVGTLVGDEESERFVRGLKELGYHVTTKPVKIMEI